MPNDAQQQKIEKLARDILDLCRNCLVVNLRFMDTAISRLNLVSGRTQRSTTDGEYYYYDPVHILRSYKKSRELPIRRYLHTVFHCIYRHMFVGTLTDNRLWDLACDIAVENSINGLELDAVKIEKTTEQQKEIDRLSKKVKYVTAEMLYRLFLDTRPNEAELKRLEKLFSLDDHLAWYQPPAVLSKLSGGAGSDSNAGGNSDSHSDSSSSSNAGGNADSHSDSSSSSSADGNSDSSSSTMTDSEWENYLSSRKELENMWKDVSEYVQTALETLEQQRGDQAGGLTQNLREVNRERYDYTAFLKKFAVMGEAMKINDDEFDYVYYTYGLQVYEKMPLVEPLEYKDVKRIREFVIAIDTSGSVAGELVQKFVQKTYNILKSSESFFSKVNIHIVQCDAEIQQDVKITSQEEFDEYMKTMTLHGFGGTDFRPVFQYVDKLIEQKEFTNLKGLIYFTDGFGIFPAHQPPYETAFVYINDGYENPEVPVWAIKIILESEDLK